MKRRKPLKSKTYLKRYTELNRSTKPLKKTPIKRMSDKKRQARAKSSKLRDAMKERLGCCEDCGANCELEEHHIAAGAHRRENANPRTVYYLCPVCHEKWQGEPFEVQYRRACEIIRAAINGEVGRQAVGQVYQVGE